MVVVVLAVVVVEEEEEGELKNRYVGGSFAYRLAPTAHWLPGHCCSPLQCIPWGPQRCLAPGLRSTPPNNTRRTSSHTRTPWAGAPLFSQRPGRVLLSMPRAQKSTQGHNLIYQELKKCNLIIAILQ